MGRVVDMEKARITRAEMDAVRHVLRQAFSALPMRSQYTAIAYGARNGDKRQILRPSDPAKIHHAKETRRSGFSRELIREEDFGWSYVKEAVADLPTPHHQWVWHRYMDKGASRRDFTADCQHALYRQLESDLKGDNKRDVVWWLVGQALKYNTEPHIYHSMEPWRAIKLKDSKNEDRKMTKSEWDKNYKRHWNDIKQLINRTDQQAITMLSHIRKPRHAGDSEDY